ncbi:MAG TPA: type II toxin-antitoxin system RelE/ParE family toxin [Kofleriaceae bacterium]
MRRIVVSARAAREVDDAYAYYSQHGRGEAFMACVDRAFERITDRPLMYPVSYDIVRRALLQRFPYSVFFVVEDDHVVVLAVSHQRRDPATRPTP